MRGFFARSQCGVFASRSIFAHLLRGVAGAILLVWALGHESSHPLLTIAGVVAAVIALRGCPTCWTVGLLETVAQRLLAWRAHDRRPGEKEILRSPVDSLNARSTV